MLFFDLMAVETWLPLTGLLQWDVDGVNWPCCICGASVVKMFTSSEEFWVQLQIIVENTNVFRAPQVASGSLFLKWITFSLRKSATLAPKTINTHRLNFKIFVIFVFTHSKQSQKVYPLQSRLKNFVFNSSNVPDSFRVQNRTVQNEPTSWECTVQWDRVEPSRAAINIGTFGNSRRIIEGWLRLTLSVNTA